MPTTINDELTRIEGAKADIATAIGGKGVNVPANAKIDDFADLIDAIQTSGGTDDTLVQIMNKTITSIDIPSGVTSVPDLFFAYCSSLSTITFPATITSIGIQSFRACMFTSLDLKSLINLSTIDQQCFFSCRSLTEIYLPSSVSTIGLQAFNDCIGLTKFVIFATNPPTMGTSVFSGTTIYSGTGKIYVPNGCGNAYKNASNWSTYANQIYELDANGNIPT